MRESRRGRAARRAEPASTSPTTSSFQHERGTWTPIRVSRFTSIRFCSLASHLRARVWVPKPTGKIPGTPAPQAPRGRRLAADVGRAHREERHMRAGGSSWRPTSPAGGLSVSKEIWPQGRRAGQGAGGGERAVALGAGCPRPAPADTRHLSGSPSRWFAVREPHTGFTLRGARHLPERGGVSAPGAGAAGLS